MLHKLSTFKHEDFYILCKDCNTASVVLTLENKPGYTKYNLKCISCKKEKNSGLLNIDEHTLQHFWSDEYLEKLHNQLYS